MGLNHHENEGRMVRQTPERDFVTKQRYAEARNRAMRVIRGIEREGDRRWLQEHTAKGYLIVLGKRKLTFDALIREAATFKQKKEARDGKKRHEG